MAARRPIRLPAQWPAHVKSGVLRAIGGICLLSSCAAPPDRQFNRLSLLSRADTCVFSPVVWLAAISFCIPPAQLDTFLRRGSPRIAAILGCSSRWRTTLRQDGAEVLGVGAALTHPAYPA